MKTIPNKEIKSKNNTRILRKIGENSFMVGNSSVLNAIACYHTINYCCTNNSLIPQISPIITKHGVQSYRW